MIHDTVKRISTVLNSVVILATGLAALIASFVTEVAPALPDGWQDNAFAIGAVVVGWLLSTAAAVRRLTDVDRSEHGLLPTPGRSHVPPS